LEAMRSLATEMEERARASEQACAELRTASQNQKQDSQQVEALQAALEEVCVLAGLRRRRMRAVAHARGAGRARRRSSARARRLQRLVRARTRSGGCAPR
jgi:hypothetical protein